MKNKHAMIITAYNDFDVLQKLLMYYNDFYDCYVHIDKRSNVPINFYQVISKLKNVHIIKKYRIFWGSYKHILAVLDLLAMAKAGGGILITMFLQETHFLFVQITKSIDFLRKTLE